MNTAAVARVAGTLVGRHPGMGTTCTGSGLAAQLGASLQLRRCAATRVASAANCATTDPVALPSWSDALPALDRLRPGPTDAIVVLSARRGTLGWRPALDRLPRLLATRYGDTNLIVAYPPEGQGTLAPSRSAAPGVTESATLVTPADVILDLDGVSVEDAVDRLLRHALATSSDAITGIVPQADRPAPPPPLELVPGAILVHIHVTPACPAATCCWQTGRVAAAAAAVRRNAVPAQPGGSARRGASEKLAAIARRGFPGARARPAAHLRPMSPPPSAVERCGCSLFTHRPAAAESS